MQEMAPRFSKFSGGACPRTPLANSLASLGRSLAALGRAPRIITLQSIFETWQACSDNFCDFKFTFWQNGICKQYRPRSDFTLKQSDQGLHSLNIKKQLSKKNKLRAKKIWNNFNIVILGNSPYVVAFIPVFTIHYGGKCVYTLQRLVNATWEVQCKNIPLEPKPTVKAQTSLHISAVWSGPSPLTESMDIDCRTYPCITRKMPNGIMDGLFH